jgi:protein-S-isoprenylcysteine O-methyltransferase Ste14
LAGVVLVGWSWSAVLVLRLVPKGELIVGGPFRLVRHPFYVSVGLLVLPGLGFVLGTWAGVPIGLALWLGTRWFAPAEEKRLAETFGDAYTAYRKKILLPWL